MIRKAILMTMAVVALFLTGCGTAKQVVKEEVKKDTVTIAEPKPEIKTYHVDAHPEVVSVADAVKLYQDRTLTAEIAKKHKYKTVAPYGIYRLDRYETMLYKNCRLPKKAGDNIYMDTPLPQAKGTSSYVAIGESVIVAVFNNTAWANLVEQVKGLGFTLAESGHEDRYTNGTIDIYCYTARKSIRIEKAQY